MREAGGRVRITAQLVSAVDGYQLWSQTYDRQLADMLAVQDDIARAVAGALRVTLVGGGNTAARAPNAEAYNLRLRALHVIKRQNPESTAEARSLAERAIALDPGYADAWDALAVVHMREFEHARSARAREDALAGQQRALEQALALDPAWRTPTRVSGGCAACAGTFRGPTSRRGARWSSRRAAPS